MALELPVSDANSSPTGGTVCAAPRAPSKKQTAQPQRRVLLRIAGKLVDRTRLLLAHKIVVINCHGNALPFRPGHAQDSSGTAHADGRGESDFRWQRHHELNRRS